MFQLFELTLLVNHACNLRCTYCYTGEKFHRRMPDKLGQQAIARGVASLAAKGTLDVAFFGGEPLLEAESISRWIAYTTNLTSLHGKQCRFSLTTNGLIDTSAAWQVLSHPTLLVSVSCDGIPAVHNRHRRAIDGAETSSAVLNTIHKLQALGKTVNVIAVVRPDTVMHLPESIAWLHSQGITSLTLSLDLWAEWQRSDAFTLGHAIAQSADIWSARKPALSVNWFDAAAAHLLQLAPATTQRCGFGVGQVAVTPRGNLYPCERIIQEDRDDHPLRLPGKSAEGNDFLELRPFPAREDSECSACALAGMCGTTCRCSNYVRTGDVQRPDGLLCWLETKSLQETARILNQRPQWLTALALGDGSAEGNSTGLIPPLPGATSHETVS